MRTRRGGFILRTYGTILAVLCGFTTWASVPFHQAKERLLPSLTQAKAFPEFLKRRHRRRNDHGTWHVLILPPLFTGPTNNLAHGPLQLAAGGVDVQAPRLTDKRRNSPSHEPLLEG